MVEILRREDTYYPSVPTLVLLAFCGYVIIWYLQIGYRVPALGEIRFEFIYAAALSALVVATGLKDGIELDCPAVKWTILLFLVIFIQVPLSQDSDHSWTIFIDRVVKFSFMAFFIICFVRSPKHLAFFLAAFLLACLKMGQEGFVGQLTGSMVWENQGVMRLHGSTPIYAHPNSFAGMALGTMPFIIYLFPIVPKYIKVVFIVQLIFAFNIVLHTGSRTGYVAFLIMMIFLILKSRNKKKVILLAGIMALVAIPFIDEQYVARFKTIYTGQEIEGASMDTRKVILEDAMSVFLKHPVGIGVGAFPMVRYQTFGRSQDTHNLYLEVATNLGIQGLIVFLVFLWKMIMCLNNSFHSIAEQKKELQCFLNGGDREAKNVTLAKDHKRDLDFMEATSKAVLLFLIVRLALGLFGMDFYEIYWWFALGLTVAIFDMNKKAEAKTRKIGESIDLSKSLRI